ncbi:MAG: RNA chaperone Hfq [Burkholderiales bacterium]|nr:RNA chaperone Hfq [Burkholderiales bacterium]
MKTTDKTSEKPRKRLPCQDEFLGKLRDEQTPVSIFLVNGVRQTGKIVYFDQYVILLQNNETGLVYKRMISTIVPEKPGSKALRPVRDKPSTPTIVARKPRRRLGPI